MRQIAWVYFIGCLIACSGCGKHYAVWGNASTRASSQGNHFAYMVHGDANGNPIVCVMERFIGSQPPNAIKWSSTTKKDGSCIFTVNGSAITPVPDKVQVFVVNSKGAVVQIVVPLAAATELKSSANPTPDDIERFWSDFVAPVIAPSQLIVQPAAEGEAG